MIVYNPMKCFLGQYKARLHFSNICNHSLKMTNAVYGQFSFSKFNDNVSSICGVLFLVLFSAFCWKQWQTLRLYRHFPSRRLDVQFILRIILGWYPKDVPFTSFSFQVLLKTVNDFRKDGICVLWILKPFIFIFNEKYMKDLVNEVDFSDKGVGYGSNRKMFGNGLLASNHDSWKVHRKLLNSAFSVGVLKGKMDILNKYARQLADRLETLVEDKPGEDADNLLKHCAFQNMADFVLGLRLKDAKHVSMAENMMEIIEQGGAQVIERITLPWLEWDFMLPFFSSGRKYLKIVDKMNRLVQEIINIMMERKTYSDSDQSNEDSRVFSSFGDILMKLYLEDQVFTETDVRDQLITFTAAGYETVYVTMLWCFYTLGHHPQVQEKAYQELESVAPSGDITYEQLAKLKYLGCVIKETLRLYSTAPFFERKAGKDMQCGQYTIPKGSEVSVFTFVMHRDPNIFPEPEKFDPERFWDSSKLRPWMYIPFAEGYRNCIGKKFAMMEIKVQLAHVLRRFRITCLNRINDSELDWTITLKPTKPLQFSFENRLSHL